MKYVDEDEKLMQVLFASGQNRQAWFVTEDGLYEVLMKMKRLAILSLPLVEIKKHGFEENNDYILVSQKRATNQYNSFGRYVNM